MPFLLIVFIVLLYMGAEDLGFKGIGIAVTLVGAAVAASLVMMNPAPMIVVTVLADIILVLVLFSGNIRIR